MGLFRKKKPETPSDRWVLLSTDELENIANDVRLKTLRALVEYDILDPETANEWFMEHTCILKKPSQINQGFFDKYKDSGVCSLDPDTFTFFIMRVTGLSLGDGSQQEDQKKKDHLAVVPFKEKKEEAPPPPPEEPKKDA